MCFPEGEARRLLSVELEADELRPSVRLLEEQLELCSGRLETADEREQLAIRGGELALEALENHRARLADCEASVDDSSPWTWFLAGTTAGAIVAALLFAAL